MAVARAPLGSLRVRETIRAARDRGASDVHLLADGSPWLRVDGALKAASGVVLSADELNSFVNELLDSRARAALDSGGLCDGAHYDARLGALRIHAFRERSGVRCAVRLLPAVVPTLAGLDLPGSIEALALRPRGLVLVVGPTGSGKTTLLAALVDLLNREHARHIITLEDPVEYVHAASRSIIAQCEIGRDVSDFAEGTRGALRADPDVIVLGELRETESMRCALVAAQTGHLVMASLHTGDAPQALDRIVDAFPLEGRDGIRIQLAQALAGVIALRLVARADGGRRAAVEILIASDAVRNLIRESKNYQLRSAIQTGRALGMQTLESHLSELVARGEVKLETACLASERAWEITVP